MNFSEKRVLVTGGTGSMGQVMVRRLLSGEMGTPASVTVFSRDEAKQHDMRLSYLHRGAATDDVIYRNFEKLLNFWIGDVRDYDSVVSAARQSDVIIHAAALKQVPTCEYFPFEAVQTNVVGAQNVVRAIRETPVELVVGVSTDKACKPVNIMGMTKAIQERLFVRANLDYPKTRFVCVRYCNVIASRGSVIPLFLDQIKHGKEITVTLKEMTRFLLTLEQAVDTVFEAVRGASPGETYVPRAPAARVVDIATTLMNGTMLPIRYTGIRPGEKVHEIMVSEEECYRTVPRGDHYFAILPLLPELRAAQTEPSLDSEYSSKDVTCEGDSLADLLDRFLETEEEAVETS